jgi:PLP dependent protein
MDSLTTQIKNNLSKVNQLIYEAATRSGRSAQDVNLVVVSKSQPVEKILAATEAGVKIFGENYPEESEEKIEAVKNTAHPVEWHMIGHLQSRKTPIIVQHFSCLHSLDSLSLAEKLSKRLFESQQELKCLLEVNVSGEESKFGLSAWNKQDWPILTDEIYKIKNLPGIKLTGLMTMPPYYEDPEMARPYFQKMRLFLSYLQTQFKDEYFMDLSMGTSGDYQVAIEEGATFVRIGHAIMGERIARR